MGVFLKLSQLNIYLGHTSFETEMWSLWFFIIFGDSTVFGVQLQNSSAKSTVFSMSLKIENFKKFSIP